VDWSDFEKAECELNTISFVQRTFRLGSLVSLVAAGAWLTEFSLSTFFDPISILTGGETASVVVSQPVSASFPLMLFVSFEIGRRIGSGLYQAKSLLSSWNVFSSWIMPLVGCMGTWCGVVVVWCGGEQEKCDVAVCGAIYMHVFCG
jgi:hypothetical protein